jgi:hypothetical protein
MKATARKATTKAAVPIRSAAEHTRSTNSTVRPFDGVAVVVQIAP